MTDDNPVTAAGSDGQQRNRHRTRWFVPPLGWPMDWRVITTNPGDRHPLVALNRYPRQVIGFAVRLPDSEDPGVGRRHRALSIMWAKPARWWR